MMPTRNPVPAHPPQRSARRAGRLLASATLLAFGLACGDLQSTLLGQDEGELVAPAEQLLRAGDLPGAAREISAVASAHPESVRAAVDHAYLQLLQGDLAGADRTLEAIQAQAGEKQGEILLRRTLVAVKARDLEKVKSLGEASGTAEGRLLAAEGHLVDLDGEKALALFQQAAAAGGVVGETASTYLSLLQSNDQHQAALAEASALWALGDRAQAVDSVEDSLKSLPEEASKGEQILLWAGRAVTSGRPDIAKSLLEDTFPPEGQQWRYQSTQAMILIATDDPEGGVAMLQQLQQAGDVPGDGLADAIATACGVAKDPEIAKRLVQGMESAAAARCLQQAGAAADAASHAPQGPLKTFLENP